LLDKLTEEASGILAWAVRGCLQWQQSGLGMPAAVKAASRDYQKESDVIGRFIDECCVLGREHEAQASKLYDSFKGWCERNGEGGYASNKFGQLVGKRNQFEKKRKKMNNKVAYVWMGIGLLSDGLIADGLSDSDNLKKISEETEAKLTPNVAGFSTENYVIGLGGEPLPGKYLAVDTETHMIDKDDPTGIPKLVVLSAYGIHPDNSVGKGMVVAAGDVEAWIEAHIDRIWIFHNASFDFFVLMKHLQSEAWRRRLIEKVEKYEIRDTMILCYPGRTQKRRISGIGGGCIRFGTGRTC